MYTSPAAHEAFAQKKRKGFTMGRVDCKFRTNTCTSKPPSPLVRMPQQPLKVRKESKIMSPKRKFDTMKLLRSGGKTRKKDELDADLDGDHMGQLEKDVEGARQALEEAKEEEAQVAKSIKRVD